MLLAMNCATGGLSTYEGLGWLDVAEQTGVVLGVTATAVEHLVSNGTGEVNLSVKTGDLDFGSVEQKTIPRAYLTVRSEASLAFAVDTVSRGTRTTNTYTTTARDLSDDALRTIPLARGPRGQFWAFEIRNTEDAALELSGVDVLTTDLTRRGV